MAEDTIPDAVVRREFFLQRFASFLINKDVDGAIEKFSRMLPSLLNEFGEAENLTLGEKRKVTQLVRLEMSKIWAEMWADITEQLGEMSVMDAKHITDIYKELAGVTLTLPSDSVLLGHIANSIMTVTSGKKVNAGVWTKFLRENTDTATNSINGAIWSGYTSTPPLTNQQIARNIRGVFNRTTKKYEGGILQGSVRAQADALVRTGTSHFSNGARDRTYAANKDVINARILLATLDQRTTLICRGRDLMEWDIDDNSYPRLPFHWNERSVYVLRVKGVPTLVGTRPAIGGNTNTEPGDFDRKFRGKRDLDIYNVKQVSADTGSDAFLRRQPASFIISTLGKTRAELFIKGSLDIKRFTDATGRTLTLDELRVIDAKAFKKAGL